MDIRMIYLVYKTFISQDLFPKKSAIIILNHNEILIICIHQAVFRNKNYLFIVKRFIVMFHNQSQVYLIKESKDLNQLIKSNTFSFYKVKLNYNF